MTSVLIEHVTTGERQVVADLEGYDEAEWNVLAIEREPLLNEEWDGQAWVFNEALAAEQDERAEVINRERLRQALKIARQRILALEDEVNTLRQQGVNQIQALNARIADLEDRIQ